MGLAGLPLAGLAARQGIGRVAGKPTRDEQKQLDGFTREAERYVAVLGEMKGVAMKVGQLVSFLDAGAIPEQHRAAHHQIVGALQADAPPMPNESVRDVIERELERPVEEAFTWIGELPMACGIHRTGSRRPPPLVRLGGVRHRVFVERSVSADATWLLDHERQPLPAFARREASGEEESYCPPGLPISATELLVVRHGPCAAGSSIVPATAGPEASRSADSQRFVPLSSE